MALKRIQKELNDFYNGPPNYCGIIQIDQDNIFNFLAVLIGPSFSPYENGIFYLDIKFPKDYPFKPLKCVFVTKVYHPNINSYGKISIDILEDQWSPSYTIEKVLLSLLAFLSTPNFDNPIETEIAKQYKSNKYEYYKKAREFSEKYADAPKGHEFYYLEGQSRIDYEYICFENNNKFSIYKTDNKWIVKINFNGKDNLKSDIDLIIDFPQDYPWVAPNLTFYSKFKPKILNEINNKLKKLWNIRILIKDVLNWIYDCLYYDDLFNCIKKIETKENNLIYLLLKKLLKEKNQNKILLEKLNLKKDNSINNNELSVVKNIINVEPKNNINENINIESIIKLLNENDFYFIINKLIGIINLGNTCYINSCLQILIHCPLFMPKLFTKINLCNKNTPFTNNFLYICWQIRNATEEINISLFKNLIGNKYPIFEGYRQNDSQELYRKLLENINSELNEVRDMASFLQLSNSFSKPKIFRYLEFIEYLNKKEKSIISDLFYFIIIPTLKCECGCENYPFQQIMDIPLLIPENIQITNIYNLLQNFFKNETVEKYCERCKKQTKNSQQTKIARPPEILNLCIQRFQKEGQKNECYIEFPEVLDLSEFIDSDFECNGDTMYFLFGIINHVGTIEFGHYYSYIKINNKDWYEFNDAIVKKMNSIDCNSSNVYSLFYLKVK